MNLKLFDVFSDNLVALYVFVLDIKKYDDMISFSKFHFLQTQILLLLERQDILLNIYKFIFFFQLILAGYSSSLQELEYSLISKCDKNIDELEFNIL